MISRVVRLALVVAVLSAVTAIAGAQTLDVRGTVQRVDLPSRIVYFTDGRTLTLDPATRLYVGNREIRLDEVQPGWILATAAPAMTPGTIIVQPGTVAAPSAVLAPAYPPVDATGVVAQVDSRTGTVWLQDGRVLQVTDRTTLWQPVTLGSVTPGVSVHVRNAVPLDFKPARPAAGQGYQMGTVATIDTTSRRVVLSDGTIVQVRPGTQVVYNGQPLAITELRPGDEVVIALPAGGMVAVNAMPRQVIEIEQLYVVRRPQAP